jgi:hypothetical protein
MTSVRDFLLLSAILGGCTAGNGEQQDAGSVCQAVPAGTVAIFDGMKIYTELAGPITEVTGLLTQGSWGGIGGTWYFKVDDTLVVSNQAAPLSFSQLAYFNNCRVRMNGKYVSIEGSSTHFEFWPGDVALVIAGH